MLSLYRIFIKEIDEEGNVIILDKSLYAPTRMIAESVVEEENPDCEFVDHVDYRKWKVNLG